MSSTLSRLAEIFQDVFDDGEIAVSRQLRRRHRVCNLRPPLTPWMARSLSTTDTRIFNPEFVGFWLYISISYRDTRCLICTTMHNNAPLTHTKLSHLLN